MKPHNSYGIHEIVHFFFRTVNAVISELQLEFDWWDAVHFLGVNLVPFLATWRQHFVFFQGRRIPAYKSMPKCFNCLAAPNCHSVSMTDLFSFLLQFIVWVMALRGFSWVLFLFFFLLSRVFFGKGGVADLFTKQLCFIGSHKVVPYLVNCFSDNQAIPAFREQMRDTFSWITHFFKVAESFRIWISATNKEFMLYPHPVSQDQLSNLTRGFQLLEENHTFKRCYAIRNGLPDPQILRF